ncbi:MAG: endopeptidase La [Thermovirgaceae bacterium]
MTTTENDGSPGTLPVLSVRDLVLFPGVVAPLFVGRPRSRRALEEAAERDRKVCIVTQKDMNQDEPEPEDLYSVGTEASIVQMVRLPDGSTKVLVEGLERLIIESMYVNEDHFECRYSRLPSRTRAETDELEPLKRSVSAQFETYVSLHPRIPAEVMMSLANVDDPGFLADLVASHLQIRIPARQELLETADTAERLEKILKILLREIEILEVEQSIHERVRQELEKGQKEFYLREQLKVIQDELGQTDESSEAEKLKEQVKEAGMPSEVQEKALYEIERLSKMPSLSAEATVVRTYVDWLVNLPWKKRSRDTVDIRYAEKVLQEDHWGLEEAKERILEFLAVRKQAGSKTKSQVLCFVGPPGVGKTSLGRSIARALGRSFVNMSLGGIRDEAEIRGHRRTYIGSLPGRIIQKIRQAGTNNPVMLLDEVDKIGADFRGDPSAALLEVLDPEQNNSFTDHFLEVPVDLSHVLFITTANVTHTIPKPLQDRMEIIRLPGYVAEEKYQIARRHLVRKVIAEHGLEKDFLSFSPNAVKKTINDYTREAGVRELERQLARIARKVTRRLVEDKGRRKKSPVPVVKVTVKDLRNYLGTPKHYDARLPQRPQKGAVIGLAWTESGGDVLVIESAVMEGTGKVVLTGNLGEIMQESAQTALGYIKAHALDLGLENFKWDKTDLHVHVPEGAIPKDGPSAGIALATVMYSVLSGKPVRSDIAMSGEITLRGEILPVGGVREKLLAAKRHGLAEVIFPAANGPEFEEMPAWITKGITLNFRSNVLEVLRNAVDA